MGILSDMMKTKIADNIIFTPENIATDMVNILPDDVWNSKAKFLDPCCKSGIFLKVIYNKLMEKLSDEIEDEVERREHILNNQLYGIGQTPFCTALSQRSLHGTMKNNCNIKYIDGYIGIVKDTDVKYKSTIERMFGANMKFDVVIGNPPYNNDMYLDFVQLGYRLIKDDGYELMITPAKWQAKSGVKNEEFRDKIVPYMRKIVYYPNAADVFDILEKSGICYYIIDKKRNNTECIVKNIDKYNTHTGFNSEFEQYCGYTLYNQKIQNIIEKTGNKKLRIDIGKSNEYNVVGTLMLGIGGGSNRKTMWALDGSLVVISELKLVKKEQMELYGNNFKYYYCSEDENKCKSFISYCNTRLIRFLVLIGCCGDSISNSETWRFVPEPEAFDHIFTDDELYKKYNLTQDEIDIIESVIKERKMTI